MAEPAARPGPLRHLVLVLGDQLDAEASGFDGFEPGCDAVWMAEVAEESTHVWSSQPRTALFLAAMRHFAQALGAAGRPLHYTRLDDPGNRGSLAAQLSADIARLRPQALVMTAPGDWRVLQALREAAAAAGLALDVREDRHFLCSVREFAAHARGRKQLRLEFFYREMRRRHGVLLPPAGEPEGGEWNYDAANRKPFGPQGPGFVPPRATFEPDALTREVIALVRERFAAHPGRLDSFAWPVTRAQALQALQRFIDARLEHFGRYQDAMWTDEPWLYHSRLSVALNLKLIPPRRVIDAAAQAWRDGAAPLAAVEGFVRQILGWREYVRGLYWLRMPGYLDDNALGAEAPLPAFYWTQMPAYLERNELGAHEPLPAWYWTGDTAMACLKDAIGQTLEHGYAHHIQRLMVTGLYALLLGVAPREVHAWYLAVYVDAVEWVELPNTLGMSQHADAGPPQGPTPPPGPMASKPYIATGQYIGRMSDHCRSCRFDPAQRTGER
ncbi:MAG: cryptochrome/photolyase family protein, partial [Betaproteobacteria bacterium]